MACTMVTRFSAARMALTTVVIGFSLLLARAAFAAPHVLPVLLVHGYDASGDSRSDWVSGGWISGDLSEVGHGNGWALYRAKPPADVAGSPTVFGSAAVYSLDYHGYYGAKGRLRPSAGVLAKALDLVTADSGEAQVYVVAHSQAGLMLLAVLEGLAVDPEDGSPVPYAGNVAGFMTIDTPYRGSGSDWLMRLLSGASRDMVAGSKFLRELNATPMSIDGSTQVSVAIGDAIDGKRDGLFSVDEQTPLPGTVPTSTVVRRFDVVHGLGILGVDYGRYTAAQYSTAVRDWAAERYRQVARDYTGLSQSADGVRRGSSRARPAPDADAAVTYSVSGFGWLAALSAGFLCRRARVPRRIVWVGAVVGSLLMVLGSAMWDVPALLLSSVAVPGFYLVGWRLGRVTPRRSC
jgi:hypothetical protein